MDEFYIFEDIEFTDSIPVKYFIAAIEGSWAHWHNEIEILFLLSGELQLIIEDEQYDLKKGDIILINSNQIHSINGKNDLTFVLQFVPELIYWIYGKQESYHFNLNTADSIFNKESIDHLKAILARIGIEYSKRREGYKFYLWSHIYELIGFIFRFCHYKAVKDDPIKTEDLKKVSAIINYIMENFDSNLSIKMIAESLNMSDYTISGFFKEKTGISVLHYLHTVRVNHAKALLGSDDPIIDIAQKCGFYSLPTFYRSFKKIVGVSPLEYKKTRQHKVPTNQLQLVQGYLLIGSPNDYALLYKYL